MARLPAALLWPLFGAVLLFLALPERGLGATHLSATTYTTNQTWAVSGSPYVLNGNITVSSGATLTIEPGVIVKFNGTLRSLAINGSLAAIGTSQSPIYFTSLQDDSVGGDTGGDGATQGAPGQWYEIRIAGANQLSTIAHAIIRFGGYGSSNTNYGAVNVTGSASQVAIANSEIRDNQRAGVRAYGGALVRLSSAEVADNATGIAANMASLQLRADSSVHDNTQDGLWFNLTDTYDGPPSVISHSDVSYNGRYGVNLQVDADLPALLWPYGTSNNVYANQSRQLYSLNRRFDVDWTGNFWGTGIYFFDNPAACDGVSYDAPGKLAYTGGAENPPDGPIRAGGYAAGSNLCGYDYIRIPVDGFETAYIPNSSFDFGAGFDSAWYSFSDSDCETHSDPISLVFYGYGDVGRVQNHIEYHGGLVNPTLGSPSQYFSSGGECSNFDAEQVDPDLVASDRAHIRLKRTQDDDPLLLATTVGTPHLEEWFDLCPGHAVIDYSPGGFVLGRDLLRGAMAEDSHHPWYYEYVGNGDVMMQSCSGFSVGSDGYVDFVYVPDLLHGGG